MVTNTMLVATKASCCVANAFSRLIWPRSSLKSTKSKKRIFCKNKSQWVKLVMKTTIGYKIRVDLDTILNYMYKNYNMCKVVLMILVTTSQSTRTKYKLCIGTHLVMMSKCSKNWAMFCLIVGIKTLCHI